MSVQKKNYRSWGNRGGGGGGGANRGQANYRTSINFGARGLFFTVDGTNNEKAAVREVYNLYDAVEVPTHAADEEAKLAADTTNEQELLRDAADELDAACSDANAAERGDNVGRGNNTAAGRPGRIRQVPTNVRNCLFFTADFGVDTIYAVADDIVDRCQQRTQCRFVARCIPVEDCCATELTHLASSMEKLIHTHFVTNWKGDQPPTYAMEFKARNNDQLTRQNVLDVMDENVRMVAPLARVNLTAPDITILVNVLHKNVLLSCVREFHIKRKFSTRPPKEPENEDGAAATEEKATNEAAAVDEDDKADAKSSNVDAV